MNLINSLLVGLCLCFFSCSTQKAQDPFSITSDQLSSLDFETLKKFGFNDKGDYLMRIEHEGQFVYLGVKTFELEGKSLLTPIFKDLAHKDNLYVKVLESPLFAEYKQYQIKRGREREGIN